MPDPLHLVGNYLDIDKHERLLFNFTLRHRFK